ncbi:MAG: porin family protein [Alphaproteobacteria bacterium]|nr:porin family protein [Alphaproteobacteria bacterium]MBL6937019.1 porin family protein [Alphaproteobacteria bacterium]MBL7097788.1 porin family protein [Alphaproteobacteria bacterium]
MRIHTAVALALILLSAAQARAQGSGIYIGGGLGAESPSSSTWHVPKLSQFGRFDLSQTNMLLVDLGYKFGDGIRVELEGQYDQFSLKKLTIPSVASALAGHITSATIFLNANYDFTIFQGWGGTIGAGLGSDWNNAKGNSSAGLAILSGSDRAFAWQVMAGVQHQIIPNVDLDIDYRYQGAGSTTVTQSGVGNFVLGGLRSQTVSASLRFYLLP